MEYSKWNSFSSFLQDFQKNNREKRDAEFNEVAEYEMVIGIGKAIAALREAKVGEEKIIELLQKYWDLRRSEAVEFLQQEILIEVKN